MTYVPNGYEFAKYSFDKSSRTAARYNLNIPDASPTIAMIGRFDPQKNQIGFLEMAAMLQPSYPDATFLMIGPGVTEQNNALANWRAELGLSGSVRLLGLRNDLPTILPGIDLLVSPSHDEGFPNAVVEALASGVPCVVTNVGDSAYLVGLCGWIVPPGDPASLAAAVSDVLDLSSETRARLGARAAKRVRRDFSLAAIAGLYADIYADAQRDSPKKAKLMRSSPNN